MNVNRICLRCMNGEIGANGLCTACGQPPLAKQTPDCAIPLQTIIHGRYLIGGALGQGGFGITYAAYDLREDRRIVIKEFFPSFLVRRPAGTIQVAATKDQNLFQKYRDRFVDEARLINTFQNIPEIVNVYHIFVENDTAYYTMEFLVGQTLYNYRKACGNKLSWAQLTPIVANVISALRVVHNSRSIHRDVSPDNIFLTANGGAKLIDFGAARNFNTGKGMTQILKKGFAPIEQYQNNGNFGPWTDIYALAATIYNCLTGQMVPEATARSVKDTIRLPTECGANIPQNVERALMQALNVQPNQRFRSIDAFAGALQLGAVHTQTISPVNNQRTTGVQWQLRCIHGSYAGMLFPFRSNIVIGRDPTRCTLVFPQDMPGISAVHLTLLYGTGPSFPGIRCESTTQVIYINGNPFSGYGKIGKLQNGDRISFGDNQIFVLEG